VSRLFSLKEMERYLISSALQETGGNISRAARLLEIPRTSLRDRMRKYGLNPKG